MVSGAGNDTDSAGMPERLPMEMQNIAQPMPDIASVSPSDEAPAHDLWQVIRHHEADEFDEAIVAWIRVELPCESEVWRHLGLGVAHLYMRNIEEADMELLLAQDLDPESAPVQYFLGLLRMVQADTAADWPDAERCTQHRLVAHATGKRAASCDSSKCKTRYQLEAMQHLERAIELGVNVDYAATLVPIPWLLQVPYPVIVPVVPPTVGALLDSLRAADFIGKAHAMLARLYLEHGQTDVAERHVDEAVLHGIKILCYGYRAVAQQYEWEGRHSDAFRVYLKEMKAGGGLIRPGIRAFENLRDMMEEN
jgi:tetratricopeptide (TPR) repeat protein